MKDELTRLQAEYQTEIESCPNLEALQAVDSRLFGRKGILTERLRSVGELPANQRKEAGQAVNQVKVSLQKILDTKREALTEAAAAVEEKLDVTLPGLRPSRGALHPVTRMLYDLNDAFHSLGFEVYEGPDVTSELFEFDNMNFPADHPARESTDTFWLAGKENERGAKRLSLRPHLTGASVRYMLEHKPPFRFVYPGRVYRNESTDAGHERAFYQYEALMVDKAVPFSSGRLMVNTILEKIFGRQVKTRMRAGFFPFVEPGFEIDMECQVCSGKGCSVCKRSGWVEMMPGGPPHPNVFRAGGMDPNAWQGFYINIGLDRLVMMKYGIDDIRLLHSGDLRFLQQFPKI